eukprot:364712-Chlamydomonas_euryale.AAC.4
MFTVHLTTCPANLQRGRPHPLFHTQGPHLAGLHPEPWSTGPHLGELCPRIHVRASLKLERGKQRLDVHTSGVSACAHTGQLLRRGRTTHRSRSRRCRGGNAARGAGACGRCAAWHKGCHTHPARNLRLQPGHLEGRGRRSAEGCQGGRRREDYGGSYAKRAVGGGGGGLQRAMKQRRPIKRTVRRALSGRRVSFSQGAGVWMHAGQVAAHSGPAIPL